MSALERATSRKGIKKRPKVEPLVILEELHDIGAPATILEVATRAGVSRNTANDRLLDLVMLDLASRAKLDEPRPGRAGRFPWVFGITRDGMNAVTELRAKRAYLESEVDLKTQGERFDRAAEKLEREAADIEARLACGSTGIDPRQVTIEEWIAQKYTPGYLERQGAA